MKPKTSKQLTAKGQPSSNWHTHSTDSPTAFSSKAYDICSQNTRYRRPHKWNPSPTWNWKHNLPASHFKQMLQCCVYHAEYPRLPSVTGWRWRRCEQTSHQNTVHGARSNNGRQPLAPPCHADYWLWHIPQSCDSTYQELPLSAPESLTPGMGLPWHEGMKLQSLLCTTWGYGVW